jgi:hypothetical protein
MMKHDPIEKLLQQADCRLSASSSRSDGLADRVYRTYRRRRLVRGAGVGACAVAMLVGSALFISPPPADPAPRDLRAEIAALEEKIAAQERAIERLLRVEREFQAQARMKRLIPVISEEAAAERAASAVVFQADRLLRTPGLTEPARQAYGRVIEHFPQTVSADHARKRLAEIEKEG